MEQLTKALGENLYGFGGLRATLGVWLVFFGFLLLLLHKIWNRNKN